MNAGDACPAVAHDPIVFIKWRKSKSFKPNLAPSAVISRNAGLANVFSRTNATSVIASRSAGDACPTVSNAPIVFIKQQKMKCFKSNLASPASVSKSAGAAYPGVAN
eukprot:10634986-Karenia_brevis.AAC.1